MKAEISAELGLCGAYEQLLRDCEQALEAWSARSDQIRRIHSTGVKAGGELLALQAQFAKAYTALRRHAENCQHCSFQGKRISPRAFDALHTRCTPCSTRIH